MYIYCIYTSYLIPFVTVSLLDALLYICFTACSSGFQGKYDGELSCKPAATSLFLNSVDLSFFMEIKSDIMKDINSPMMLNRSLQCYFAVK